MHPNYHIHQSPKKITVRDENLKLAPSLPSHAQPKTSFRNSCDTAHTFFTMLSGNEGDSLSNLKGEDLRKDPQRVIASNKDIQSLLNNISSLNSKLQDAKKSLTPASSYNEQSSVAKKYVGRRQTQRIIYEQPEKLTQTFIYQSSDSSKSKEITIRKCKNKASKYYLKHLLNDREHHAAAHQHLEETHYFLSSFNLEIPQEYEILSLPRKDADKNKKVLVLDMDETLVHCQMENQEVSDFELKLDDGEKIFVTIRPYALSFIKKMSQYFEIIVFTASEQDYADAVLDQLDPNGLIRHRLYRQHCLKLPNNLYTKDLRIINRDLSKIVLIDNSAASFLCQLDNSIPILPFEYGEDSELLDLQRYLIDLSRQNDVRPMNRRTFKLEQYRLFQECQEIVPKLYNDRFTTTIDFQ